MTVDPVDAIRAAAERLADAPPPIRCLLASHAVPYGQVYRQWDTNGELFVWVNRGEIADVTSYAARRDDGWAIGANAVDSSMLSAIPVMNV